MGKIDRLHATTKHDKMGIEFIMLHVYVINSEQDITFIFIYPGFLIWLYNTIFYQILVTVNKYQ